MYLHIGCNQGYTASYSTCKPLLSLLKILLLNNNGYIIGKCIILILYPQLKINPFFGKNINKLINYNPPAWRYRIGNYRLFYEIDQKEKIIYSITIEIRSKAY